MNSVKRKPIPIPLQVKTGNKHFNLHFPSWTWNEFAPYHLIWDCAGYKTVPGFAPGDFIFSQISSEDHGRSFVYPGGLGVGLRGFIFL